MTVKSSFKYIIFIIIAEICMYNIFSFGYAMILNTIVLMIACGFVILFSQAIGIMGKQLKNEKDELSGSEFHRILITGLKDTEYTDVSTDPNYVWEIVKLDTHKYHIIGSHPVARRIGIIKTIF
jgi:hypothetical protein